jgi:N-acetylglucosaminyl-diphospho-decaprenol L-rhamnosyltransferase
MSHGRSVSSAGSAEPSARSMAIVVVNYGSHDLLTENLRWAQEAGSPGAHDLPVIVVNNYRCDEDTVAIRALADAAGWTLVDVPTNVGFGAAVNLGARRAWELGCVAICVVNPDLVIPLDVALALRRAVLDEPLTMTSPMVVGPDGRPWGRLGRIDMGAGRLWTHGGETGVGWLSGACLCLHRDLWGRLGGFDVDYFMYWEDVDLSYRCVRAGGRLALRDDLVVTHQIGGTQAGTHGKSKQYYYYNCRNRLVFAAKNLDRSTQRRWALTTPGELRRVTSRGLPPNRTWQLRHAVPAAVVGSLAGLRWLGSAGRRRR